MKRSIKKVLTVSICAALIVGLVSCAAESTSMDSAAEIMVSGAADNYGGYGDMDFEANSSLADNGKTESEFVQDTSVPVADSARKLIKNVSMDLETKTFDSFMTSLETRITEAGGYIQTSSIRGSGMYRYASVTVRIPADRLDSFTDGVSGIANVVRKSENTEDVTLEYYDMESHIRALRSEYDTLLQILEKCTELNDVIRVQQRITEVLYQIESYQSRLNNYDNLVSYSTVSLSISEVQRETAVEEQTVGRRIADGLSRTMEEISGNIQDFVVCFAVNLPYILIWSVLIGAGVILLRVGIRRRARRIALKKEEKSN